MTRREAREQAFALIFQMGFNNLPVEELLEDAADSRDLVADPYAVELAGTVQKNMTAIDAAIDASSKNWRLNRLPKVTAAILRLAVAELDYMENISTATAINEAVELSKKYGDEEDASYVNGVLGGYVRSKEA